MKCIMDCFSCRLPPSKCHGGNSKKTANPYRFVNRSHDGKARQSNRRTERRERKVIIYESFRVVCRNTLYRQSV